MGRAVEGSLHAWIEQQLAKPVWECVAREPVAEVQPGFRGYTT
jgi:hypothetical protein